MKITQVKIFALPNSNVKALASITLDSNFVVTGLKVIEGKNGLFVSMPNRKTKDGEYKDIAFPITKEFRQELMDTVLGEYNKQRVSDEGHWGPASQEDEDELPF